MSNALVKVLGTPFFLATNFNNSIKYVSISAEQQKQQQINPKKYYFFVSFT